MAETETTTTDKGADPKSTGDSRLALLNRNCQTTAYVLFAIGAVFVAFTVWFIVRYRSPEAIGLVVWTSIWSVSAALIALGTGLWWMLYKPSEDDLTASRIAILAAGGLAGLVTVILGIGLAIVWWDDVQSWIKDPGPGQNGYHVLLSVVAQIGGLWIMFVSLQMARTIERTNALLRQLLYGYNAFLGGVLLFLIILVVNVLIAIRSSTPEDFTERKLHTLSSDGDKTIRDLKVPVKAYMVLNTHNRAYQDTKTLLLDCQALNDKFQVFDYPPEREPQAVSDLRKKYPEINQPGVLLAYGDQQHGFIPLEDLFTGDPQNPRRRLHNGEDPVMAMIRFLAEDKKKPVIYFTQRNGELDLENIDESTLGVGAGILRNRLERRYYDVRPLQFFPADPKVPEDASLVVIAGPEKSFPDYAVKALRDYMDRKGKMLVLLGVVRTTQKEMLQTGIEPLLAAYDVQVGNGQLLKRPTLSNRSLDEIGVTPAKNAVGHNPIASAFDKIPLSLVGVRPVMPAPPRPSPGRFSAQTLFVSDGDVWAEPDLKLSPMEVFALMSEKPAERLKRLGSFTPIPVAVTVTDSGIDPNDPRSFTQPPGKPIPRLMVVGDATFASNRRVSEQAQEPYFDLFTSMVDWLRGGSPTSIGIKPRVGGTYRLDPAAANNPWSTLLGPPALVLLGIIGLGTTVWLVRRR